MNAAAVRRFLGAGLGLGWAPIAPGSAASLAVVGVFGFLFGVQGWLDGWIQAGPSPQIWQWYAAFGAATLAMLAFGQALARRAGADWGAEDPGGFVVDEFVGQALPLLVLVPGPARPIDLAVAFLAFRVFDVFKPPPCRSLERLGGGVGIMADDLAAGIYALLVVMLVRI